MTELRLRQVRSSIGSRDSQRDTLRALGLGAIGRRSSRPDTADVRAMVKVVEHLVEVESDVPNSDQA
ncbi:MAG: 50S ribosomal protein L30 [Chloroflexota bacterium]|jgi:large subunit ribosomal protein L30|nr:50S ribosomal protein L30 [Chloroflexota bacterium]MDE2918540.1 50S ribosomal protein L30 [Chloroflexota bacterium]